VTKRKKYAKMKRTIELKQQLLAYIISKHSFTLTK